MGFVSHNRRALFLAVGIAMACGGCKDNNISLTITQFIAPELGATCMYESTGATTLPSGTYDLALAKAFGSGYIAAFIVQNNLEEIMGANVETQGITVESYNVMLEVLGPLQTVIPGNKRSYNYLDSTLVLPPLGFGVGFAQIIGVDQVASVASINSTDPGSIIAHIQPVWKVGGGDRQTGDYATFPINVCVGCLLGTSTLPACPLMITSPNEGNACNPAADIPITCCQSGTGPLCGANVAPQT
jgi:hypothetical protein